MDGDFVTCVLDASTHCDGMTIGVNKASKQPVWIYDVELPLGTVCIFDFKVVGADEHVFLRPTDESHWSLVTSKPNCLSDSVLELCAGVGGMGVGASFLGGRTVLSVDFNGLSCKHLNANNHGKVLQLDLNQSDCAKTVQRHLEATPGTATMGFPCQPFSTQGLSLGSSDARFQVLVSGLKIIYLCQAQSAILECVPAAGTDPEVVKEIQTLAHFMDFDILTTCLDLRDQWPCKRSRWWAILLPKAWNTYGLRSWSRSPFTKVSDLFKKWGSWSEPDETDLQLLESELVAYSNPTFGSDKRIIEGGDVVSTILHSYGNALGPCPCGCRDTAFSVLSLASRGLRGSFVQSQVHHNPRFLHPRELGLLLGMPDSVDYRHSTPRECLALLGLVASPIQMVWVYAHLKINELQANDGYSIPNPQSWLNAYLNELLRQTSNLFQVTEAIPQFIHLTDPDGSRLVIASPTASTVADLLQAERITLSWNEAGGLAQDGVMLPLRQLLDSLSGPYLLSSSSGPWDRHQPSGLIMIGITHGDQFHTAFLQAGQFLFEALREMDLLFVNFLVDHAGTIYGADFRVWRTLNLVTLAPEFWPPRVTSAAGPAADSDGLHDGHIHWMLERFLELIPEAEKPLIISVATSQKILHQQPVDFQFLFRRWLQSDGRIICIFEHNLHWTLLWGQLFDEHIHWYFCDGLANGNRVTAQFLAAQISEGLTLTWTFSSLRLFPQEDAATCGTIALLHVASLLGFFGLPDRQAILSLHHWLVSRPSLGLGFLDPWTYGYGPADAQAQLAALLATKGVPSDHAADRAAAAIKRLSLGAVQTAMTQANPWQSLKALTTKPGCNFQFVLRTELQTYIDSKAKTKHGAAIATHKKKDRKHTKSGPSTPVQLDPATLQTIAGDFVDSDGDELEQISLQQVVADSRGIALSTLTDALPYLREPKNISSDTLAILILEEVPDTLKAAAEVSAIRFPVTYLPTQDPLLVNGSLLQLGDKHAARKAFKDITTSMDVGETSVLKITMYRDELASQWDQIAASPVKCLLQMVPVLRRCTEPQCDLRCGLFHPAVEDDVDQVIIEVWGRRFQSLESKVLPAPKADMFIAFLRIATPALDDVLKMVADGVYLEPRAAGVKATDSNYAVIWLAGANRDTAVHRLKLSVHGLSLVRMKTRFGIRVPARHEEAAHRELRPGDSFLKVNVARVYRLHPLPHGLQRAQLIQLLKDWAWAAKPLQPSRGTAEGGAWEVGSELEPPNSVLQAFNKDVLVSLLRDKKEVDRTPQIIGSNRAQKHLRNQDRPTTAASASTDPWQANPSLDPWKSWRGPTTVQTDAAAKRIDAITATVVTQANDAVRQQLDAAIQNAPTAMDQRIQKLETDMVEIKTHNATVTNWIKETGTRLSNQDDKLNHLNTAMQQQQQDLISVRTEVHTSADNLHQAMAQSFGSMKDEISNQVGASMTHHMERFEQLLVGKIPRRE